MDEDNSSNGQQVDEPADDSILSALGDTEDTVEDTEVEETQSEESTEAEGEAEPEQQEEEQSEEESTASEDEGESTEEEPEDQIDPKEEARRRYEERQRVKEEREQRIREQNKEYLENSTDEYDQRLRAMEVQQYAAVVENNENTLIAEFDRAKANPELQIFNPDNKESFNQRAYDKAMRDYNAGYIDYDQHGNMVRIKGSLYEHLTETADLFKGAIKSGQVQQVKATRKMQVASDSKPAAPPKEQKSDPILDILSSD